MRSSGWPGRSSRRRSTARCAALGRLVGVEVTAVRRVVGCSCFPPAADLVLTSLAHLPRLSPPHAPLRTGRDDAAAGGGCQLGPRVDG